MNSPLLSALGLAFIGFAAAWLAVALRLPVPAAILVWAGCVGAVASAGVAAVRASKRQIGHRRTVASAALALATLVLLPGCLVLPAFSGYVANNFRLAAFADQLHQYPAPPGARVSAEGAEVGVLTGNGDHCDYIATVIVEPYEPVSRAEVERYYAGLQPRSAVPGGDGDHVRLSVEATLRESVAFGDSLPPLYIVQLIDIHGPNADFRCW